MIIIWACSHIATKSASSMHGVKTVGCDKLNFASNLFDEGWWGDL